MIPKSKGRISKLRPSTCLETSVSSYCCAGSSDIDTSKARAVERLSPLRSIRKGMATLLRRCRRPGWIVTSSAPLRRFHVGDEGTRMENVRFASIATPVTLISRVVIYDGVCNLCNSGLRWVAKKDKHKQIYFCAVQSEAAKPYLYACDLTVNDVLKRFLFIEGLAEFSQGSTAALRVLRYLPLPYSMLSVLLVIPVPMRDTVYDYIAKHRYEWFGRTKSCILPDDEILDRFIDRDELKAKFEQSQEDEEM